MSDLKDLPRDLIEHELWRLEHLNAPQPKDLIAVAALARKLLDERDAASKEVERLKGAVFQAAVNGGDAALARKAGG